MREAFSGRNIFRKGWEPAGLQEFQAGGEKLMEVKFWGDIRAF